MATAHIKLPYRAEYYRQVNNRSSCKHCKDIFQKGTLRFALIVRPTSLLFEEKYSWYHSECFFKAQQPECVGDIENFEFLRYNDQEKIKDDINKYSISTTSTEGNKAASSPDKKDETKKDTTVPDLSKKFRIEYSISSRAKCRKCVKLIMKDAIRVCKIHCGERLWYHLDCFAQVRDDLKFLIPVVKLRGFELLTDADQSTVKKTLVDVVPSKAPKKISPDDICSKVKNALPKIELDQELLKLKKAQNEKMFEYRDQLSELSTATLRRLMEKNELEYRPDDKEAILDGLADAMTFGVLQRCPNCKDGLLEFRQGLSGMSYYCSEEDEWTSCASHFDEPPRYLFRIPRNMKRATKNPKKMFLRTYDRQKTENRIFERNVPSASTIAVNKGFLLKKTKRQITVASPTSVKLLVENGAAVDPLCRNADKKRVYRDTDNIYSASLLQTDLQAGTNSYCNIQILESIDPGSTNMYTFFQSWGEVGIPGLQKEECTYGLPHAIYKFEKVFLRETHNAWSERLKFQKKPGKKVLLDLSYGQDTLDVNQADDANRSRLDKPIQELIKLIFDRSLMRSTAKEMELDLNKMPLGKLSKSQIQDAYEVLTQLQNYLTDNENGVVDPKIVMARSNKFYTLIPHNFTTTDSPVLDSMPVIQKKFTMLDSLLEIEIACSLMLAGSSSPSQKALVDSYYESLKTNIRLLSETEAEFANLKRAAQNTHADTHNCYTLEIIRIFKVERVGEDKRYARFQDMPNKRLLWHGSRTTNFAGILSMGLRIAPPRAPTTGHMFGRGIYFADMVSKAANYCYASKNNDTGLIMLCEVALGHMKNLFNSASNLQKPPPGFNSVKGLGRVEPNPDSTKELYSEVTLASGRGVASHINDKFLNAVMLNYNEYIVYNEAQVNVKYLFQVKFKFKH